MIVAVELLDLINRVLSTVDQTHQFQIIGQYVLMGLQLVMDEVQGTLPERCAGHIQKHDRHQGCFAGLHQRQHFQHLVQRAKTAGANDQGVCFFEEKQLAGEEEVKSQLML